MRIEYQYEVDLRDFKEVKSGQMYRFNGFCKTVDDCIEESLKIVQEHPEVQVIKFKRVWVFPRLGVCVHFLRRSIGFFAYLYGDMLWFRNGKKIYEK